MKHLGDITKISGFDVPIVNVVIGGSPCQDLSVAGKRAGLKGGRSGLFMEQIRIIREMRERDEKSGRFGIDIRPRFMVWENVPGVFSVNGGRDFGAVIEETIRVVDKEAPNILPPKNGWTASGCFLGRGWSVAWRVLDAQFWGVPQRRRRITLIADFGGQCAPEILFERESMSGNSKSCKEARKGTAGDVANSVGATGKLSRLTPICVDQGGGKSSVNISQDILPTLSTTHGGEPVVLSEQAFGETGLGYWQCGIQTLRTEGENRPSRPSNVVVYTENMCKCYGISAYESNAMKSSNPHSGIYEADTSRTLDGNCGNPACNQGGIAVVHPVLMDAFQHHGYRVGETSNTLTANQNNSVRGDTPLICSVDCRNGTENPDINGTLQAKSGGGTSYNLNNVVRSNYIVRRLTPLECERLQGYPDGWTNIGEWADTKGKKHKDADSPRYKALGNSIAIPPWLWVLSRLNEYCEEKTMASLFDGIGGFPLIWEYLNGKGSAVWCSEIEEFPIAVTKKRFPDV